jgi:hypothetical protein
VDGYTQLVTDRVRAGWSCNLVTFLFSQPPGPRSAVISRMRDEVHRIYSTLLTRVHRKPRTASTDELPVLVGVMDLPVHKHNKLSGPMVLCNGGLHVHALMLMPPTSRLKGSLTDHFRDNCTPGLEGLQRIDVRPVVGDHGRVVDYVLPERSPLVRRGRDGASQSAWRTRNRRMIGCCLLASCLLQSAPRYLRSYYNTE